MIAAFLLGTLLQGALYIQRLECAYDVRCVWCMRNVVEQISVVFGSAAIAWTKGGI
jgi:hypothetical protein